VPAKVRVNYNPRPNYPSRPALCGLWRISSHRKARPSRDRCCHPRNGGEN